MCKSRFVYQIADWKPQGRFELLAVFSTSTLDLSAMRLCLQSHSDLPVPRPTLPADLAPRTLRSPKRDLCLLSFSKTMDIVLSWKVVDSSRLFRV